MPRRAPTCPGKTGPYPGNTPFPLLGKISPFPGQDGIFPGQGVALRGQDGFLRRRQRAPGTSGQGVAFRERGDVLPGRPPGAPSPVRYSWESKSGFMAR